jgi:hypothetical protein
VVRQNTLAAVPSRLSLSGQREAYWVAFWLLLPATAGLLVFTFAPLVYVGKNVPPGIEVLADPALPTDANPALRESSNDQQEDLG